VKKTGIYLTSLLLLSSFLAAFEPANLEHLGEKLKQHVKFLGADSLKGRAVGTAGEQKAAEYIATQLEKAGALPAAADDSFFQPFPLHSSRPLSSSQLSIFYNNDEKFLLLDQDYLLYSSGAQTFIPKPIPIVFAGHGIVAPEYDYNDYNNLDVRDKIVVFLAGEPISDDPDYFHGSLRTIYSNLETKNRIAIARGARGTILLPNIYDSYDPAWQHRLVEYSFDAVTLPYKVSQNFSLILNPKAAFILFEGSGHTLEEIYNLYLEHRLGSFALQTRLSFRGQFQEHDFFSQNVIAKISGTRRRPAKKSIVLVAHYDHLGVGKSVKNDSIYNGVVDNALGVAAVLTLAELLKTHPLKHSVLFLLVSGEEKGVLGSKYYIQHPVVPHYQTLCAVNIDGLAIFDRFQSIVGIGGELSTLGEILLKTAHSNGLFMDSIASQFLSDESFIRSDQIAFARAGIPSVLVMDGLEYENYNRDEALQKHIAWMRDHYHMPFDDLYQPINWQAAAQHVELLFRFLQTIDHSATPVWYPGTMFKNARLQSIAEKR